MATKRPQNKCKSCGNMWYPRGKNLSSKCPNCGSKEVSVKWPLGSLAGLALVGAAIFGGGGDDKPKDAPTSALPHEALSHQLEPIEIVAPPHEVTEKKSPMLERIHASEARKIEVSAREDVPLEDNSHRLNTMLTPTSICSAESNIFSRNNCEWRECEKPEFTDLAECSNKKSKEEFTGG